jgi:lysophospholipase L1-like esterase
VIAAAVVQAGGSAAKRRRSRVHWREILGRTLLVLAAVGLALAACELAMRVVGVQLPPYLGPGGDPSCTRRSALLGVELTPGCNGKLARTTFRTNAQGLRGPELDPSAVHILALGDSCTWGARVADDETYPAVLERLLNQRAGARRYQVLNAGVPGWTSHQGLLYLSERGLPLAPRIVVLGFQFNDGFAAGDIEEQLARARRTLPLLHVDDALIGHSVLYSWIRLRLGGGFRMAGTPRVSVDKHRANLERLVRLAREHGAQAAMIDWNLTYLPRYREVARAVAEELAVPRVVYEGDRVDIVHPTAAGYESVAAKLLAAFEREGYLGF